ncbi:MAG: hypothetical protein KatS3mg109_0802 [Pirellulaceae bacterium]|nr:MAG: hypothetical protein KatS3mg109_0802 [Pirellulaceae bacterium]GIW94054.1 MAG: hypothetical protein KatS3mg110_2095 [Pirellulaceae bacterium]
MAQSPLEPICVRCARVQKTCCQTSEVYVSPGDVRRIAAYTGQWDFFHDALPSDPVYAEQDDDPPWRDLVFQPDGKRRILRRQPSGDCVFLGPAGCRLPLEVRPLVCRLYPFDYDCRGIKPQLARGCPLQLVRPGMTILEELDMSREQAEQWHRQLYAEIAEEPRFRAAGVPCVTNE